MLADRLISILRKHLIIGQFSLFVVCACMRFACMHASEFVQAIPCTNMHGFQNNRHSCSSSGVEMPTETFVIVG